MAIRDYICCKSCGWKFIYDGYYSIRDELDASYGTCDLICPSCLDELEVKLAKLEQAQQEPAQSVPAFWASENILKESLRDNISCILTTTRCSANTVPLYTVPPAIDDETRKMVLELCKVVDNYTDIPLTKQIREKLEAGNEN